MGDLTKNRLDLAASWASRTRNPIEVALANGGTHKVEWAGKTLRLRARVGRHGPRLDLGPRIGSRLLSLFVVGFIGSGMSGPAGQSIGWLLRSLRAEVADPTQIGLAALVLLGVSLFFGLFFWAAAFDHDWSFEPHRATRRLNLLGVPLRTRTYHVIDATGCPDSLVLRSTNSPDVAVKPSGLGLGNR